MRLATPTLGNPGPVPVNCRATYPSKCRLPAWWNNYLLVVFDWLWGSLDYYFFLVFSIHTVLRKNRELDEPAWFDLTICCSPCNRVVLLTSSGSSSQVGGKETWHLCSRLWRPSFLWLIYRAEEGMAPLTHLDSLLHYLVLWNTDLMSQCLSDSGCSKDQENYDWTTAELISETFIEVTSTAHSLYRKSVQTCRWYTKDTNKMCKLPLF